jgi:hypothetical protein
MDLIRRCGCVKGANIRRNEDGKKAGMKSSHIREWAGIRVPG